MTSQFLHRLALLFLIQLIVMQLLWCNHHHHMPSSSSSSIETAQSLAFDRVSFVANRVGGGGVGAGFGSGIMVVNAADDDVSQTVQNSGGEEEEEEEEEDFWDSANDHVETASETAERHHGEQEEGMDEEKKKDNEAEESEDTKTTTAVQPKFFNWPQQEHYYYELLALTLVGVCIVNYFRGKKLNEEIALEWGNTVTDFFVRNFSRVRRTGRVEMVRDSPCEFKMFASGRKNVRAMICTLHLSRRQDLVSQLLGMVMPAMFDMDRPDTLVVEVALNEDKVDPLVFTIFPAKNKDMLLEEREDLKHLAKVYPADNIIPKYAVATDAVELTTKRGLLPTEVQNVLSQYAKYFVSMHVSDLMPYVFKQTRTMQFTFQLPKKGQMEEILPLMNMVLVIADRLTSLKLSDKAREANIKARREFIAKNRQDSDSDDSRPKRAGKKTKSLVKRKQEARAAKKERARREREEREERPVQRRPRKIKPKS